MASCPDRVHGRWMRRGVSHPKLVDGLAVLRRRSSEDIPHSLPEPGMVRTAGLEPARLTALEPKSSASTSSATSAGWGVL